MRINKYLASTGIASRRKAEQLVLDGRVKVNGKVITDLAYITSQGDQISVDDKLLSVKEEMFVMMHKPKGYVTTAQDNLGRKTVMELLPEKYASVMPVGRLDYNTEGLLIFTNNGDIAKKLTSPISEIEKTYVVKVEGNVPESSLAVMRKGVVIDGIRLKQCRIKLVSQDEKFSRLQVVITEGKNRQIRKMFDAVGLNVVFLKRTKIGEISLGGLTRGCTRELNAKEITYLKSL